MSKSTNGMAVALLTPSLLMLGLSSVWAQQSTAVQALEEIRVLGTAEEELLQAPGVSIIGEKALKERPPVNDLAEIIRTMPGVNLTGNSSSGAYGNNRQIDLRGMGPENTLILIDGKPVHSRDAVRMGRMGERNTRGDTNWVPVEAVERIEVLRGPAAARYGSGAAGGVVNIITKRPTAKFAGSVTLYQSITEDNDEGDTRRMGFNLSGPLSEKLSFRLYGNIAKTNPDSLNLNAQASSLAATPSGREGVRNKDINGLLRWDINPEHVLEWELGFGRQGNIYAGDYMNGGNAEVQNSLFGDETNTTYRRTTSLTHRGDYGGGKTSRVTLAYEGTDNYRMDEGLAGSVEGTITAANQSRSVSKLTNYHLDGEYTTPLKVAGLDQVLTVGAEWRQARLNDPFSSSAGQTQHEAGHAIMPSYSDVTKQRSFALFVEDNIELSEDLVLTPGLRFDHHDQAGSNWSPSLNASYYVTPEITIKGGIARAFKAPNLYQSNPSYLYSTMGMGCPDGVPAPCWIVGNDQLQAETSINKELGVAYDSEGWTAGLTYFQNDYKNKIVADYGIQGTPPRIGDASVYQWVNSGKAIVRGFEGNFNVPLLGEQGDTLKLINNFTYMQDNKSRATNQPLSVIPRYTVNSTLNWQATEKLNAQLIATFYGKQKPRTQNPNANPNNAQESIEKLQERGAYSIFGVSAGYQYDKDLYFRVGVNNMFDKRLYREAPTNGAGAATYNEPGRFYYLTLTASF